MSFAASSISLIIIITNMCCMHVKVHGESCHILLVQARGWGRILIEGEIFS